jgi:hypothetical protein
MKKVAYIFTFCFLFAQLAQAQYNKRGFVKNKGNCFCDAMSKKKGSWYMGPYAMPHINYYNKTSSNNIPKRALSFGLHAGTNITEKVSVQVGISKTTVVKEVERPGNFFPLADYTYLDIPIEFIFRFPKEESGIIPYALVGLNNNFILKQNEYKSVDDEGQETKDGSYNSAYLKFGGGIYFLVSNNVSVFTEPSFSTSLANAVGDGEEVGNYDSQLGLSIGFNYHF